MYRFKLLSLAHVIIAGLSSFSTVFGQEPAAVPNVDIAIYGGTSAGVIAAVAAKREGKSVVLLSPDKHLGGLASGGLGATDVGSAATIGGYSREFFNRVRDHYVRTYGENSRQAKECNGGFRFEPHVAEKIFEDLILETKIPVHREVTLESVVRTPERIKTIRLGDAKGRTFDVAAKIFLDASYEGDLLAKAKITYRVGRESRAEFGESLAGVQAYSKFHQWPVKLKPNGEDGRLLPFIQPGKIEATGAGDQKVQAYNFRMCMTQRPEIRVPFPRPKNYDPARYALLARYLAARPDVKVGQLMNPVPVPNGKTDTNNNGPFSTDHIGANWDYPDADYEIRKKIYQDHVDYQQGFMYFLANDKSVPEKLHREMNTWGLAKGEFEDNGNWPRQLYIREARRMAGLHVMSQKDIMEETTKPDTVAYGSYNADSHHVQRVVGPDGTVLNEGDFQVRVAPYAIAFRALLPKRQECANLIVPVCVSSTHVAYGTIRMEPVFMMLGHAAGVAASLASDGGIAVQDVSVSLLQKKLADQKSVLSTVGLKLAGSAGISPEKLAGIVVDDVNAEFTGDWTTSNSSPPFVGSGYHHDGNADPGAKKARFTPTLSADGTYDVRLYYSPHANRSTKTLVVVKHAGGETTIRVNQRQKIDATVGKSLGSFRMTAGKTCYVEVRNEGADGYVIADAVAFERKK